MPQIILFRGKAGVGKTMISNIVAQHLNLLVIHKDDIYDALSIPISDHTERNEICDNILKNIIKTSIANKTDILIDSSYHYLNQITAFKKWIELNGGTLKSILLTCSDEQVWKNRFERRKINPKPNNLITDFEALKKHYKSLDTASIEGELILDTVNKPDVLVDQVIQWLGKS